MPAWLTLAGLPWGTILKQAAVLLKEANQLRTHLQQEPPIAKGSGGIDELRQRAAELEEHQRANADLLQQLADQTAALAVAAQATAVKTRQAFVLAIAGVTLGLAALLLAWLR